MSIDFSNFQKFKDSINDSVLEGYERDNETYMIKCNHYKLKIKHFTDDFPLKHMDRLQKIIKEWIMEKENDRRS